MDGQERQGYLLGFCYLTFYANGPWPGSRRSLPAAWIAEGIGVVKTAALIQAAGKTDLLTTSELRSFTLEAVVRIGS